MGERRRNSSLVYFLYVVRYGQGPRTPLRFEGSHCVVFGHPLALVSSFFGRLSACFYPPILGRPNLRDQLKPIIAFVLLDAPIGLEKLSWSCFPRQPSLLRKGGGEEKPLLTQHPVSRFRRYVFSHEDTDPIADAAEGNPASSFSLPRFGLPIPASVY